MSDLRKQIEDHVTNAACTGWCDSTMSPNDLVIREATDAIMELIAAASEPGASAHAEEV